MAIKIDIDETSKIVRIEITEQFNLSLHKEFGDAINAAKSKVGFQYIVDMGQVDYMDSSALGMLLLLRDSVGRENANISIVKCKPSIKEIFSVANFSQLFNIS